MKLALVICVAAAGCHLEDRLAYAWDDRTVLCSQAVDDLSQSLDFGHVEDQFALAEQHDWVALIHAHQPDITVSTDMIERVLQAADDHHLNYVTFDELRPDGPGGAGVAFAFDDDDIAGWLATQDRLAAHGARVTYFVTRWYEKTQDDLANLAMLAANGHDLEPHSHDHVNADDYVHEHSIDAYLSDQVIPSIQIMIDAGYHPTSFAFPFGATTPAISEAVLQHIDRVRTTPGPCPY